MRYLLLSILLLLSGCSFFEPYAEIGVGYNFNHNFVKNPTIDYCKYPFFAEIGIGNKSFSISARHDSHVDCGFPADTRFDYSTDKILLIKRFD